MKQRRIIINISLFFVVFLLATGTYLHGTSAPNPEDLVTPLSKLTPAVQAVVAYPEDDKPVPDERILEEAYKDKPELREIFKNIPIKLKHNDRHVIILICSPDGRLAWLEDASWTLEIDKKWYEIDRSRPAEISLDLSNAPVKKSK